MSLTKEVLEQNEALKGLEENQINAIVELSVNDENIVIGAKTGEIYGNIDKDIKEVTGTEKPEKVKTYDWLKNVLGDVKKTTELKSQVETLTTEKQNLETKLAKGGNFDTELKQQLDAKITELEALQGQYTTDTDNLQKKVETMEKNNTKMLIDFETREAEKGLTFIDALPESTRPVLINSAKSKILSEFDTEFIDNGDGGKKLVFKKDGVVQNNPENKLNPYTMTELFQKELKDSLKVGGNKKGAGSNGGDGGGDGDVYDLSTAKTQLEADDMLETHLMKSGLTKGSKEFQTKFREERKSNNVSKLPMR